MAIKCSLREKAVDISVDRVTMWSKNERCLGHSRWIHVIKYLDSSGHNRRRLFIRSSNLQTQLLKERTREFEGTDRPIPSSGTGMTSGSRLKAGNYDFATCFKKLK